MRDADDRVDSGRRRVWPKADELAHLVRAAQQGEPGALDALLTRIRPAFVAWLEDEIGRDEAEDAAQAALIYIARALPGMDPERALSYVIVAARHLLDRACKRRARDECRLAPVELGELLESRETPDRELEYRELARAIRRLTLTTLPRDLRVAAVGLLRGLSPAEIAAQQSVHPATMRTRVLRARALLRRELQLYTDLLPIRDAAVTGGAPRVRQSRRWGDWLLDPPGEPPFRAPHGAADSASRAASESLARRSGAVGRGARRREGSASARRGASPRPPLPERSP